MTLRVTCPACQTTYHLPDNLVGKKVRCQNCQRTFLTDAGARGATPASDPPRRRAGPREEASPLTSRPLRAPVPPRGDYEPPPVSHPGAPGRSSFLPVALILAGVGAVLLFLVTLVGVGAWFLLRTPAAPPNAAPAPVVQLVLPQAQPQPPPAPAPEPQPQPQPAPEPQPQPQPVAAPPAAVGDLAGGGIPLEILQQIKDATVYVKVEDGTGSGFVVRAEGETLYVVTNDHVILTTPPPTPTGRPRPARVGRVSLVFYSGTGREQTVPATVLRRDPQHDLALLRTSGVREKPVPLDLARETEYVETMPVYIFGYPFGQMFATGRGGPAITVNKGSVSSIRRDDRGDLAAVQLDGSLNPGNSGGPVTDAQGRLVGVAAARLRGANIGLAVPTREVNRLLARTDTLPVTVPPPVIAGNNVPPNRPLPPVPGKAPPAAVPPRPVARDRGPAPKSQAPDTALATTRYNVQDLNVTEIRWPDGALAPAAVWAADGRSFYVLEGAGRLSRVGLDDFKVQRRLDTGWKCSWLSLSAEGLVVTVAGKQEAWVVDPNDLQVKTRIDVPSTDRVAASPKLSVAFAGVAGQFGDGSLSVLDLKKGEVVRQVGPQHTPQGLHGFQWPTVTPDGKYLFTLGGIEQLQRYRITGTTIRFEEASQRIAQNGQAIVVSPDSQYVCLPSGGGNYNEGLTGHPRAAAYSTFVYPVASLNRPAFVLESGAYPRTAGFDPKAGLAYAQNHDKALILFTLTGLKRKEYTWPSGTRGDDVKAFLPHPDGHKLLMLTSPLLDQGSSSVYVVDLPKS